jgi:GNAT superfamily N-acetyltransferase
VTSPIDPSYFEQLSILDAPDNQDIQFLDDCLSKYNVAITGITDNRLLAIFKRDRHDNIIAGLHGWTWGGCCEIRTLWIHEQWRRQGLGTRLMTAAEDEARKRGAFQMVLSTFSFQAPDFYRRLGFEQVCENEDYPVGHQNILFLKRLDKTIGSSQNIGK